MLDEVVRPARGRVCLLALLYPGRSGFALRLGGYDKSDLSEVLLHCLSAYLSVIHAILR